MTRVNRRTNAWPIFPFALGEQSSLVAFLDQMKGAQLEIKLGPETVSGTIAGARVVSTNDRGQVAQHETVTLLTGAGELRSVDLGAATSVKLTDPKLQTLLKDYLNVLNNARSKDKRSVYIDSLGATAHELVASYMTPSAVWKSSYRLLFAGAGEPMLEGWAIVDNTSGEDWTNVKLSVVSGRPISFITQLYAPRYVQRPTAELAEDRAVAPQVFQGQIGTGSLSVAKAAPAPPAAPRAMAQAGQQSGGGGGGRGGGVGGGIQRLCDRCGGNVGSLERHPTVLLQHCRLRPGCGRALRVQLLFSRHREDGRIRHVPVSATARGGGAQTADLDTETMGLHPMNAAEVSNSTGKTLDKWSHHRLRCSNT